MVTTAPFGSWPSPITAAALVADAVRLSDVLVDGDAVLWVERRPAEKARQVIVRWTPDAGAVDVVPAPYSCRTLVHEYGGLAYAVRDGVVWFVNADDQGVWRVDPGAEPRPILQVDGARFADLCVSPDGGRIAAVRERHLGDHDVVNDIVTFPVDTAAGAAPPDGPHRDVEDVRVEAEGHDFFAAPRFAPDGRLALLSWDHPNMPWDGTDLWVDGEHVAGGRSESISQPRWLSDGRLAWASDASGWWNLVVDGVPLTSLEAELSGPDWVFGQATYAELSGGGDGSLVAACWSDGLQHLARVSLDDGAVTALDSDLTSFAAVRARGDGTIACIAGSAEREPAVVILDTAGAGPVTSSELRASTANPLDAAAVSRPEPISFPTSGGRTAHALFYAPHLPGHAGPDGERPPLVVMTHGGPTGSTSATLSPAIQWWTTRGIAVVDVNYGGSTGYGREYRNQLQGAWGIVDVDDAVAAAEFLAARGDVDRSRMVIRGGSAGGFTTLAALTFRDGVFAAGTSLYGVGDLEALARDTHKFEARYLDGLVGPYPEARDVYVERSPIHHTDRLTCPLLLLQGSEDKVVPPNQAEAMAAALRAKGIPFAHVVFEGEQHGFRHADNIVRAAELELWFYGAVLGFDPADDIEPGPLENAGGLTAHQHLR